MLKLNVGLSRKIGEANYGSRGASVNLELEVESGLVSEPKTLRDRVRTLFQMARASVDEELNGHHGQTQSNGNGHADGQPRVRSATQSQVRAIHAIASKQRIDLPFELRNRFSVDRPEELSIRDASSFIDAIKPNQNGDRQ